MNSSLSVQNFNLVYFINERKIQRYIVDNGIELNDLGITKIEILPSHII